MSRCPCGETICGRARRCVTCRARELTVRRCADCGCELPRPLMGRPPTRCAICGPAHRRRYYAGRTKTWDARREADDLPDAEIERRICANLAKLRKVRAA